MRSTSWPALAGVIAPFALCPRRTIRRLLPHPVHPPPPPPSPSPFIPLFGTYSGFSHLFQDDHKALKFCKVNASWEHTQHPDLRHVFRLCHVEQYHCGQHQLMIWPSGPLQGSAAGRYRLCPLTEGKIMAHTHQRQRDSEKDGGRD